MKTIYGNSIPNGTKFVAFLGDGSGCKMFKISGDGDLIDAKGDIYGNAPDTDLCDRGYVLWMPIPQTFKLWCER